MNIVMKIVLTFVMMLVWAVGKGVDRKFRDLTMGY
jgi:hypothetical protein